MVHFAEDGKITVGNQAKANVILDPKHTVASAKRSADLSLLRYREGFSDYQRVLDSQQTLFAQEQRYVDVQGETVRSLVALYKALGGGWAPDYRAGFVNEATRQEMERRVDWGELLEPAATDPNTSRGDGTFRTPDR